MIGKKEKKAWSVCKLQVSMALNYYQKELSFNSINLTEFITRQVLKITQVSVLCDCRTVGIFYIGKVYICVSKEKVWLYTHLDTLTHGLWTAFLFEHCWVDGRRESRILQVSHVSLLLFHQLHFVHTRNSPRLIWHHYTLSLWHTLIFCLNIIKWQQLRNPLQHRSMQICFFEPTKLLRHKN